LKLARDFCHVLILGKDEFLVNGELTHGASLEPFIVTPAIKS
jgi:hypothetical protein